MSNAAGLFIDPLPQFADFLCRVLSCCDIICTWFSDGMTPLMVAASAGNGLEQCPASSSAYDVSGGSSDVDCLTSSQPPSTGMFITQLLRDGATVNDTTERTGETSLHLAARYARADAAKRLLEAGERRWR